MSGPWCHSFWILLICMMGAINFEVDHKVKGKINGTHYANNMQ